MELETMKILYFHRNYGSILFYNSVSVHCGRWSVPLGLISHLFCGFEIQMTSRLSEEALRATKNKLRKLISIRLQQLTSGEIERQSKSVLNQLRNFEAVKASRRISVYLSTSQELGTDGIIEWLMNEGKICYVPRYEKSTMTMVKLDNVKEIATFPVTKWNIRQPCLDDNREDALNSGGLDVILVPGVAFTKCGKRLGHGKGFYDKYIELCNRETGKRPILVGLALNEQMMDDVPIASNDVYMDYIANEGGIM